ncbi:MAG TPA: glycoside hydrolase family 104 protein [Noviherbaspirillum sp.]|nr:glycoside hydrolase family 104 protein [Noviherbaspirillum sp.]
MDGISSSGCEIGDVRALPVRTMPWHANIRYPRHTFPTERNNFLSQIFEAIAELFRSIGSLFSGLFGGNRPRPLPMPLPGRGNGFAPYNDSGTAGASSKGSLSASKSDVGKQALAPNASGKELEGALKNRNVQAFLKLIRTGEGTLGQAGYRTMFGGSKFNDFSSHPYRAISASGITSTAAGAYQFLDKTWNSVSKQYGLKDFSPRSQDIAALALIKQRGALGDVMAGRFDAAIAKCNKEWASLPGSPYGQPTLTYAKARQVLASAGAYA